MQCRNAAAKPAQHIRPTRAIELGSGTAVIEPLNAISSTRKVGIVDRLVHRSESVDEVGIKFASDIAIVRHTAVPLPVGCAANAKLVYALPSVL